MKAPDKIYIPIIEEDGKRLLCTNWWENDARNAHVKDTIPYIRKDALIKWTKENRDSLGRLSYGEFIDRIDSM